MKVSVEISYYPIRDKFIPHIVDFVHRLKEKAAIEVITNTMSTQIFGEYEDVMEALHDEIKKSFENPNSMFVMKIFNGDTRDI
ncbi:MAG: hypothetical protein K8R53_07555 [Bacteroidales bacterium]|nr:hypothetical protein [Bacteroidales bacterium]